jgi:predicted alpha/beta-hydrolase family hydrolase
LTLSAIGATTYPAHDEEPYALLVLAHGAGAGQTHPFMVATARGLAHRGVDVVTFDFPYMAQRRGAPDRPPVLEESFRRAIEAARAWSRAVRMFIGGKSMGGRIATHLGAQAATAETAGADRIEGIVALGYPLHPPGKPGQLRIAHLPDIVAPVLIVQGERDAFGTPAELEPVVRTMRARVTLHVVAGADHSLAVRGNKGAAIHDDVLDVIRRWMDQPS